MIENYNCNIVIENVRIERKDHAKFLGVTLDQHLNWTKQFEHLSLIISRIVGILHKIKDFLPKDALLLLYKAFILSYLSYGNIAWGNGNKKQLNSILLLQKRAIRICTHSHYLANTNPIFKRLKLLKITDINVLQTAVFMFKLQQNLVPYHLKNMFVCNNQIHSHDTRKSTNFHLYNPITTLAFKSIRHRGPDIWHSLTNDVKQCTSLHSFKRKLKNNLIIFYD